MPSWDVMRLGCKKCLDATSLKFWLKHQGTSDGKSSRTQKLRRNTALYNLETSFPIPQFVRTTTSLVADWHLFKGGPMYSNSGSKRCTLDIRCGHNNMPSSSGMRSSNGHLSKKITHWKVSYAWLKGSWMERIAKVELWCWCWGFRAYRWCFFFFWGGGGNLNVFAPFSRLKRT